MRVVLIGFIGLVLTVNAVAHHPTKANDANLPKWLNSFRDGSRTRERRALVHMSNQNLERQLNKVQGEYKRKLARENAREGGSSSSTTSVTNSSTYSSPSQPYYFDPFLWTSFDAGPPCTTHKPRTLDSLPLNDPDVKKATEYMELIGNSLITTLAPLGKYGAYVQLVYGQQTLFAQGFGSVNASSDVVPTGETIFRLGSISKVFTSLLFMQSVERGIVNLNDPVTKFYNNATPPAFDMANPYESGPVTLHGLATFSSGLPREIANCFCAVECYEDDVFDAINNNAVLFPEFTYPHYSNFGLNLLGQTLSRAWGVEYTQLMEDNILTPLGMTSSGFNFTSAIEEKMATGYLYINGLQIEAPNNEVNCGWANPAAGLFSTGDDIAKYMKWYFSDAFNASANNNVLGINAMNSYGLPGTDFPDGISDFGFATFARFFANGHWTLSKGGLVAGFGSEIAMVPDLKIGVSITLNLDSGSDPSAAAAQALDLVVPLLESATHRHIGGYPLPPSSEYTHYMGAYGNGSSIFYMQKEHNTTETGVFYGSNAIFGYLLEMVWAPEHTASDWSVIGFRYYFVGDDLSCYTRYGIGDDAVAYFYTTSKGTRAVAFPDYAIYYVPKLIIEE